MLELLCTRVYAAWDWVKRAGHRVTRLVVVPFIGTLVATICFSRIVTAIVQPDSYKIYFVGPFNDASGEQDPTTQIWNALDSRGELPALDGVRVVLHRRSDFGNEESARLVATELAEKPDTLMVIGHVWSSQTRAALPIYLDTASPAIPVLMTTETSPNLLPPVKDGDDRYRPVFRLSPTDDTQAQMAANKAIERNSKAIWIVEAGANRVYSDYLARRFFDLVEQQGPGRVVHWTSGDHGPAQTVVAGLNVDFIFFIGECQRALVLLRQLKMLPLGVKKPEIVFSDNAMDDRLWSAGLQDAEGSHILFPVSIDEFRSNQYRVYGSDAYDLIKRLIDSANRDYNTLARCDRVIPRTVHWILGLKRASDARNAIGKSMERAAARRVAFPLANSRSISFDLTGVPSNRLFQLSEVSSGGAGGKCPSTVRPQDAALLTSGRPPRKREATPLPPSTPLGDPKGVEPNRVTAAFRLRRRRTHREERLRRARRRSIRQASASV